MATEQEQISRLKQSLSDTRTNKEIDARRNADLNSRLKQIQEAPLYKVLDFYCKRHEFDFRAVGRKEVLSANLVLNWPIRAVYRADCPKCADTPAYSFTSKCVRRITDTAGDPYYSLSPNVKRQQREFEIDMLQPSDPRFRKYYGDPDKKRNEAIEKAERGNYEQNT